MYLDWADFQWACVWFSIFFSLQNLNDTCKYVISQLFMCSCFMLSDTLFACADEKCEYGVQVVFVTVMLVC